MRPASHARAVGYRWVGVDIDEVAFERLCERGVRDGYVTQYDGGRGRDPWVDGRPGAQMRRLRRRVAELVSIGSHAPSGSGRT